MGTSTEEPEVFSGSAPDAAEMPTIRHGREDTKEPRLGMAAAFGAIAGLGLVMLAGALVVALSYVSTWAESLFLLHLSAAESLGTEARLIRGFLAAWPTSAETAINPAAAFEQRLEVMRLGIWGLALHLMLAVPLGVVGRRLCGRRLAPRLVALGAWTIGVSCALGIVGLFSEHATHFEPTRAEAQTTVDTVDLLWRGTLLGAVVGFFALGVAGTLPGPARRALLRASTLVASLALATAVVFAVLLPLGRLPDDAAANRQEIASSAAAYASGLGVAAVPLLAGARASLDVPPATGSPFAVGRNDQGVVYVWPELARTLERESPARIGAYAFKDWLEPVAWGAVVVFLIAWTLVGAVLRRPPEARRLGHLVSPTIAGATGAVLAVAFAALARTEVSLASESGSSSQLWGKQPAHMGPVVVVLAALPIVTTLFILSMSVVRDRSARGRRTPASKPPDPVAAVPSAEACRQCGAALRDDATFCTECGQRREPIGVES